MSQNKSDQDRIRAIQRKQLAMRDPGDSKIPGYDWAAHSKRKAREPKEKPLLQELLYIMPTRWKGALYGILFGIVLGLILVLVLPDEFDLLAIIPVLISAVFGFVIGQVMQNDMKRW